MVDYNSMASKFLWGNSHDLFKDLGEMILIKETQAVSNGFDRLISVLQ